MIGKKNCIIETQCAQNVHLREQHYNEEIAVKSVCKPATKAWTVIELVKPQALAHSKRDSTNEPRSWSADFLLSSKIPEFDLCYQMLGY